MQQRGLVVEAALSEKSEQAVAAVAQEEEGLEIMKEAAEKAQAADGGLGLWDREGFFCGVLWLSLVGGGSAGHGGLEA